MSNANPAASRRILVDANILLRIADRQSPQSIEARNAVTTLTLSGDELFVTPQVLIEFRVVATRPVTGNGLGWTAARAVNELATQKAAFSFLADNSNIFSQWERLSATYTVEGKQGHDCRLVAVMLTHNVSHILTYNVSDFRRYQSGEGITVLNPSKI